MAKQNTSENTNRVIAIVVKDLMLVIPIAGAFVLAYFGNRNIYLHGNERGYSSILIPFALFFDLAALVFGIKCLLEGIVNVWCWVDRNSNVS